MIIDFHTHAGKNSKGKEYSPKELIANMEKYGIQTSCMSLLNGVDTRPLNDKVYSYSMQYPGKILGFAYINPRDPNAIDEVHRCLGELKMVGVKFHSWKCGYFPDNNLNLDKVIDAIEPYHVPILTHTGTAPLSLPQQWAMVAKRHPNQVFVLAHIGYLDFGYGCIEAVKDLPNCYVETSGQIEIPILEKAYEDLGADRIIFGTDWPYKYVGSEITKFECLNLSEEDKRKIFYENARKLLRL